MIYIHYAFMPLISLYYFIHWNVQWIKTWLLSTLDQSIAAFSSSMIFPNIPSLSGVLMLMLIRVTETGVTFMSLTMLTHVLLFQTQLALLSRWSSKRPQMTSVLILLFCYSFCLVAKVVLLEYSVTRSKNSGFALTYGRYHWIVTLVLLVRL